MIEFRFITVGPNLRLAPPPPVELAGVCFSHIHYAGVADFPDNFESTDVIVAEVSWFRSLPPEVRDEVRQRVSTSAASITVINQDEVITPLFDWLYMLNHDKWRQDRCLEFSNVGTWDWHIATNVLRLSERTAPLLGYGSPIIDTTFETYINAVHSDDRQMALDKIQASLRGEISPEIEHRVLWHDGSVHWVAQRGAVLRDERGQAIRMLGITQDITDRVLAREAAARASRAKTEFLASMSHELRAPLNTILGFAQLLEKDRRLADDQKDSIQEILGASRHLAQLMADLLDLSQPDNVQLPLNEAPCQLIELIDVCFKMSWLMADKNRVRLHFAADDDRRLVVDRLRLKQILLNLLSNAIKYNREGGSVELTVRAAHVPGHTCIEVTDTGCGIAPERQAEVFEPFNRLGAEASDIEGAGVGLAIVKRLVKRMGGRIGFRSVLGQGSTFWLELPDAGSSALLPARRD